MTERDIITGNIFREKLYSSNNVPMLEEQIGLQISNNFDSSDFLMQALASQLLISSQIRKDPNCFLDISNQLSKACFEILVKLFPEITFFLSMRGKSFLSELFKRYEKVQEDNNPIIKDLLALRIIVFNGTTQETLKKCYQIFYTIMSLLTKINNVYLDFPLTISEPDKLITSSDFDNNNFPDILLPEEYIIPENFNHIGKDYFHFPKSNGYQSLHGSFEIPYTSQKYAGVKVEVQVRTWKQHKHAELPNSDAEHSKYKQIINTKMNKIFQFDPKKVHIAGYSPCCDISGLTQPVNLSQIPKNF